MNVSLTPELEKLVNSKLRSGMYYSASEVVREGLRLLQERDEIRRRRLAEIGRQIDTGFEQLEQGEGISGEKFFNDLRARSRRRRRDSA